MNTKRGILSIVLVLALVVTSLLPVTQTTVLAADNECTFTAAADDEGSYNALKRALGWSSNSGAVNYDDDTKTITVDCDKFKYFNMDSARHLDLSDEAQAFINELFFKSANLEQVLIYNVGLEKINFTTLDGKNLKNLEVIRCGLTSIPNISLPNLEFLTLSENDFSADGACVALTDGNFPKLTELTLYSCNLNSVPNVKLSVLQDLLLSENTFSADGACDNLNGANFPQLKRLYLDWCGISDITFLQNMKPTLTLLSLARNNITDASLDELIGMKDTILQNLVTLGIGSLVHQGSQNGQSNLGNTNKITDITKIVSLIEAFPNLTSLDLSNLEITSLEPFKNVRSNINMNLTRNNITDFAGLENNPKITLGYQDISLPDKYSPGQEYELPQLLQRILDPSDALNGKLDYQNCSLSADGTKLVIDPNVGGAQVKVTSGKLSDSKIVFTLKKIPAYTIPKDLTATVGDTLAKIALPQGFEWEDDTQDVGVGGVHTFKAVYTPQDTDTYAVVTVDVPVTVKKLKPSYTIPQDLMAAVGNTLADVALPAGFTWKDAGLSVGAEGNRTFKAVYTPQDTDRYEIVDDIDVPVTVKAEASTEPTEPTNPTEPDKPTEPMEPTKPVVPTEPTEPTKPVVPTEPDKPTEPTEPVVPTEPNEPTKPNETVTEPTAAPSDEYDEEYEDETEAASVAAAVNTSDTSPVLPVTVLLLVSGMVICITVLDKRKSMKLKK